MRIIHCGDIHLDSKMQTNLSKEQAKERNREILGTFLKMMDYAREQQVSAILIAGDLFDTKRQSALTRREVLRGICEHESITFYYLPGNHEEESFLSRLEQIPDNLKLFQEEWKSYPLNEAGTIVLTGAVGPKEGFLNLSRQLFLDEDVYNIVMLHGQEVQHEGMVSADEIPVKAFANRGIDYLALGHIHKYKKEVLDSRGEYCYCGCLEGRGFDECGAHGFVLLDIDEDTLQGKSSFVPFAKRELHTVEVPVTGCLYTGEMLERTREVLKMGQYEEKSLLKIVLTGEVDVECEKEPQYLLKQLEGQYYYVKISDETKLAVQYERYKNDSSLKGEFIRTVNKQDTLKEEEKAKIIRCGLLALAGEEF